MILVMVTLFQNCSVSPGVDKDTTLASEAAANPSLTPSKLVYNTLIETNIPSCFPRMDGAQINQKTMEYKEVYSSPLRRNIHLRAYVHQPPARHAGQRLPVAVIFHGGGWSGNDPTYWFPLSFYLASRGVVAINFQYRVYQAHQSTPVDSVRDALSAVRWVKKNAEILGVDFEKMLVFGDSAGGHLALSTALVSGIGDEAPAESSISTVPQALYTLYPVVSTSGLGDLTYSEISPHLLLSPARLLPPTVLWQGTADSSPINPPALASQFCNDANTVAGGTRCYYLESPGAEHAFVEENSLGDTSKGRYQEVAANLASFLTDLGYITANRSTLLAEVRGSAAHCSNWTYGMYNAHRSNYGYVPLQSSVW